MKNKKRSPLKSSPLRNPGQSLDEEISGIIDEAIGSYVVLPVIFIVIAGLEWWRWYTEMTPNPIFWSIVAIGITIFSLIRLGSYRKRMKSLKLGRDGERAVGQYLELLREKGCRVFHDLIGDNFNLDHVVVCEHGIFSIETKTYSKPTKGNATVVFNGKDILIDGFSTDKRIITQAYAEASWLQSILSESTGKSYPVRPVVVFPGWYVETKQGKKKNGLWVLNPKALPAFIENTPKSLTKEDMMLASFHISRFIRASNGIPL